VNVSVATVREAHQGARRVGRRPSVAAGYRRRSAFGGQSAFFMVQWVYLLYRGVVPTPSVADRERERGHRP